MRAFARLAPALCLAIGALSVGCGSGDDNGSPVPVEAGHDGTAGDGGAGDAAKPGEGGADAATGGGDAGAEAGTLALEHVFYIMMENHSFSEIIGTSAAANAPYLNQLASQYGVASSYYGVTHPSLPNYLAAISGDFQGIFDDCAAGPTVTCAPEEFVPGSGDNTMNQPLTPGQASNAAMIPHWFAGRNLVDQLEDHGLTWVAYMQSIAGVGDTSEYWPYATAADGGPDLGDPAQALCAEA